MGKVGDWIISGGAISAAIMAIGTLIYGIYRLIKRILYIADAVSQLKPDGGSSASDKIDVILKTIRDIDSRVKKLEDRKRRWWR